MAFLSKRLASLIGKPEVEIDSSIKDNIMDAVNKLKALDSNYFKNVERIMGMPDGAFGKTDGKTIYINYAKVVEDAKANVGNIEDPNNKEQYKELLSKSLMALLAHEVGHVNDFKPDQGFMNGEGPAESEESRIKNIISNRYLLISRRSKKQHLFNK